MILLRRCEALPLLLQIGARLAFILDAVVGIAIERGGGLLYDPEINYERVRDKIMDFDSDKDPVAQSTRTVDSPAQNAALIGPPNQ